MPHNRKPLPELIAYHEAKAEYARKRAAMWAERAEKSERRAAHLRGVAWPLTVEAAEVTA